MRFDSLSTSDTYLPLKRLSCVNPRLMPGAFINVITFNPDNTGGGRYYPHFTDHATEFHNKINNYPKYHGQEQEDHEFLSKVV